MGKRARQSKTGSRTKIASPRVNARARINKPAAAVEDARVECASKRELEFLVDYHSRLLARLTHELRNPLTSILGFAEILLNYEKLSDAQTDFCQKIQNSAMQIEGHLSLLADLSRLDAGQDNLYLEEFSVADALRESCAVLGRQARKQNATLKWRADENLPPIVSDRSKLRQVLYNFLAYAISRSPDGASVVASVEKHSQDFHLTIEDEGGPLPESSEMFGAGKTRPANETLVTAELGLVVARQLINALGAKLSFKCRRPRGLTVSLQIPSAAQTDDAMVVNGRCPEPLT
jgi:signal transduction histidine kinase